MKKLILLLIAIPFLAEAQQVQYYDSGGRAHNTAPGSSGQALVSLGSGLVGWATITPGSGTVTSITPAYGFTSTVPITTAGSLIIDTAGTITSNIKFLAGYNVLKTANALKVNYTDTAAMLSPIVHKALVETITGGKTFSANTAFSGQVQTNTFRALSGNVVFARSNNAVIGIFSNSVPNWGFGSSTVPTAIIHETLASTGAAGTAALKLTSGTLLTTPETGAIEYDGARLYLTTTTGPTRNTLAYLTDVTGFANPMTTLGDVIYGGASGAPTRLAGNTATSKQFLTSTGNGTISAAPAYYNLFGSNQTWTGIQTFTFGLLVGGATPITWDNGTFATNLVVSAPSANRTITLPDATGTVALTSDLPIAGSFSGVGTATTTFTVTIGSTQANNTYKVNVTPTDLLGAAVFYVNNKTTTTFDVVYLTGLTGTLTFDWALFK